MKNGGNDYKYFGAVEHLKQDVFNTLKEAGLPIARWNKDSFAIAVPEKPVNIAVSVEVTTKDSGLYSIVSRTFAGTRIHYTGYAMSRQEGFSRHMRPSWDEEGRRWAFKPHDLVRKTRAALQHAARVYDWREKRKGEQEVREERIRAAFPECWENLRIHGNVVEISTTWGEVSLKTEDGRGYTISEIEFTDPHRPIEPLSIKYILAQIEATIHTEGKDGTTSSEKG